MSVRIQTATYGIKESVFGITCLVPSDDIEEARYQLTILTEERDALARTLATLAAAGITTGEDGETRWHGLTGAEVEGMKETDARFRDAAMLLASLTDYVEGEGISAQAWYQEFFWAISDIQECVTEIEPDYTDAALTILRRANERYPYRTRHLAAAAGRGADGEGE